MEHTTKTSKLGDDVEYTWVGSLFSYLFLEPETPREIVSVLPQSTVTCNPLRRPLPVGARNIVCTVSNAWRALLPFASATGAGRRCEDDMPVEALLDAIQIQADASRQLGAFMLLVVKCDEANINTVRLAWERRGRPAGVRALLAAEKRGGVQVGDRMEEGCAALALLWCMRMKLFWVQMGNSIADEHSPTSRQFGLAAYAEVLEPYHGWLLRNIHRSAMRALPTREEFLRRMSTSPTAAAPPAVLTAADRTAVAEDLSACVAATHTVAAHVLEMLHDLELHDTRRL